VSLNKAELFQTLLKQSDFHPSDGDKEWLHKGEVESVTVYKNEKLWKIELSLPNVLPFSLYLDLKRSIQKAFHSICTVDLTIVTTDPVVTEEKVRQYWNYACKTSGVDSPICNKAFEEVTLSFREIIMSL